MIWNDSQYVNAKWEKFRREIRYQRRHTHSTRQIFSFCKDANSTKQSANNIESLRAGLSDYKRNTNPAYCHSTLDAHAEFPLGRVRKGWMHRAISQKGNCSGNYVKAPVAYIRIKSRLHNHYYPATRGANKNMRGAGDKRQHHSSWYIPMTGEFHLEILSNSALGIWCGFAGHRQRVSAESIWSRDYIASLFQRRVIECLADVGVCAWVATRQFAFFLKASKLIDYKKRLKALCALKRK